MKIPALPTYLMDACNKIKKAKFEVFLVGGIVRDFFIHGQAHWPNSTDFDLATSAPPEEILRIFGPKRTIPTGIKHGTVTVLVYGPEKKPVHLEITTFRTEVGYTDRRRPDEVKFLSSIYEDLARRDFTMNAIAYCPFSHDFIDPFGGILDIENCLIRAVGEASVRFSEDGLRILRAIRFVAQLGFHLHFEILEAIPKMLFMLNHVSIERIREEILKLLGAGYVQKGLTVLQQTDLLFFLFPELRLYKDSLAHVYLKIEQLPPDKFLRLCVLFLMTDRNALLRLQQDWKLSTEQVLYLNHILQSLPLTKSVWTASETRRFLQQNSPLLREHLFVLWQSGISTSLSSDIIEKIKQQTEKEARSNPALFLKDLKITGTDLMQHLNLPAGRQLGEILNDLLEQVIEKPELNDESVLLRLAEEYIKNRSRC